MVQRVMHHIQHGTFEQPAFAPSWMMLNIVSTAFLARLDAGAMLSNYREQQQWREQAQVRQGEIGCYRVTATASWLAICCPSTLQAHVHGMADCLSAAGFFGVSEICDCRVAGGAQGAARAA
jgi:hypothetical protein